MAGLLDRLAAALRRCALAALLLALAGVVLLTAAGFGVAALHLLLAGALSPPAAAAVTAGLLLALAGVVALIALAVLRRRPPPVGRLAEARPAAAPPTSVAGLVAALPGGTWERLAIALAAGVAVGASPELRRELVALLRSEVERRPPPSP